MNNAANTKRTNQVNPHSIIHHPFKNDRNRKKKKKEEEKERRKKERKGGGWVGGNTQTQRRNAVPSQNCGIFWVSADCLLLLTCSLVGSPHPHRSPSCTTPPTTSLQPPRPPPHHSAPASVDSGDSRLSSLVARPPCHFHTLSADATSVVA